MVSRSVNSRRPVEINVLFEPVKGDFISCRINYHETRLLQPKFGKQISGGRTEPPEFSRQKAKTSAPRGLTGNVVVMRAGKNLQFLRPA